MGHRWKMRAWYARRLLAPVVCPMVLTRGGEGGAWDISRCWEAIDSIRQARGRHHHDRDHARHRGVARWDVARLGCAGHYRLPYGGHLSCGVLGAAHWLEGRRRRRGNLVARGKIVAIVGLVGRIWRWRIKPSHRARCGAHWTWWEGLKRVGTSKLAVYKVTRSCWQVAKTRSRAGVWGSRAKRLAWLVARDVLVVSHVVLVGSHWLVSSIGVTSNRGGIACTWEIVLLDHTGVGRLLLLWDCLYHRDMDMALGLCWGDAQRCKAYRTIVSAS